MPANPHYGNLPTVSTVSESALRVLNGGEPRRFDLSRIFTDDYCDCPSRGPTWPSFRATYHLPDCGLHAVELLLTGVGLAPPRR